MKRCLTVICFLFSNFSDARSNVDIPKELDIAIKRVLISGREFPASLHYETEYNQNNLLIELKGELSHLQYRLVKNANRNSKYSDWRLVSDSYINILNLSSGIYTFEVSSSNEPTSAPLAHFSLEITKPWWREWWFWAVSFVTLFSLFYGRESTLKKIEDEEEEHQRKIVELELRTLQLQMNPHFIFNALNSIQSYVMTQDTLMANTYLTKFATLIRMFLDSSRSKYLIIAEEIKLLTLYIEMENLRFEDKFDFEVNVDPDVNRFIEIPTMILQPFVENAINHGLRYKKTKGKLTVNIKNQGNYVICQIIDNGVGRKNSGKIQVKSKKGYISQGIKITQERLNTFNKMHETKISFTIHDLVDYPLTENTDVGTSVQVKFPKRIN